VPGFQKFPEIEISFTNIKNKKKQSDKETGEEYFIYTNNDDITGEVNVMPRDIPFEHTGIILEMIGTIGILLIIEYPKISMNINLNL
jgi:hypothetical protein